MGGGNKSRFFNFFPGYRDSDQTRWLLTALSCLVSSLGSGSHWNSGAIHSLTQSPSSPDTSLLLQGTTQTDCPQEFRWAHICQERQEAKVTGVTSAAGEERTLVCGMGPLLQHQPWEKVFNLLERSLLALTFPLWSQAEQMLPWPKWNSILSGSLSCRVLDCIYSLWFLLYSCLPRVASMGRRHWAKGPHPSGRLEKTLIATRW